jgi:raffinose/stachyose/melibiose transport system substrate-binding protein
MNSKFRKILACVVMMTLIATIMAGCGNTGTQTQNDTSDTDTTNGQTGGTQSDAKTTISFMTLTSNQDAISSAIKEYEQQNPNVEIKASFNSTDDQKKNLKIAASSKTLPDIWRNWGGSLGSYYPENGLSYDLTEYAKAHNWEDKFVPAALELATLDGQLAGYPFVINALGIFYRKDMFEKYNIAVPQTFDDFEKAMETLKNNGITPISTAGKYGWHVMRLWEELLEMYCGSETHDKLLTLDADWSQEGVVKSFTKLKEWIDKGYFPEGYLTADPNDTKLLLYQDKAAMGIEGPWFESNSLIADGQDVSKYGFFKMPLIEDANRMSGFIEMIQFNADLSDEKLDQCMNFVEFMYSPETVEKYQLQQPLPYKDNKLPDNLVLVPQVVDAMNEYGTFTITDQALPQEVVNKLFEALDSIGLDKMTPEEAAQFMQQAVEEYKNSNN